MGLIWIGLGPVAGSSELTPWSRALEKLTGPQSDKFSAFYGTRRAITWPYPESELTPRAPHPAFENPF